MGHLDEEDLAGAALGEELRPPDAEHLAGCAACQAEVAAFRSVLAAGSDAGARSGAGAGLEAPPARIWDRVAAEAGFDEPAIAGAVAGRAGAGEEAGAAATPAPAPPAPTDSAVPSAASPSSPRRWRTRTIVWTAAASIAVGAGVGVAVAQLLNGVDDARPLASAVLEPLPGWSVPGTAAVTERDGRLSLTVDLPDDTQAGYQEVWLISTDLTRLISVGVLDGDSGTFTLPAGIDLADFAIVDVSDEAFDGDPGHSGVSIVRGELSPSVA
ncbi:anti-sigma factor [Miniimonas arenae]|uniref:Anti-sigma factor n=1 Tax=Miniimonas arenae TaxID=676201 RepID=A0A5C5BE63_9MICO|nr:anti-sigma factor [Miniimonas arenae]TNU74857.1 anti-sigma factor [Miniimonas arenae]